MKKKLQGKDYLDSMLQGLSEPSPAYITTSSKSVASPLVPGADYPYNRFEQLSQKVPFTLKDWSEILHLSDRTLQRYAQANHAFEGLYSERLLQIEQLIHHGLEVFKDGPAFYAWLQSPKTIMGKPATFDALYYGDGIRALDMQLNRILYGVFA